MSQLADAWAARNAPPIPDGTGYYLKALEFKTVQLNDGREIQKVVYEIQNAGDNLGDTIDQAFFPTAPGMRDLENLAIVTGFDMADYPATEEAVLQLIKDLERVVPGHTYVASLVSSENKGKTYQNVQIDSLASKPQEVVF